MNYAMSVFIYIDLRNDAPEMLGYHVSCKVFHTKWAVLESTKSYSLVPICFDFYLDFGRPENGFQDRS
jgi:hypothetical protein